ncbi:Bug family tripartite tricarboxylate transporter substrate binding protein [Undibacter mobilis]|uniref:Tripartite tricarboxylate transporter substrate binding protein n=1 Tax=Undibacter mobilis TaxID=2292256 RepID=A0A371BAJ4_9BRAD|nr:tripartite tricarboxylate transporter substrate binding protein [Undibacter mobilis]RDV04629.1 tripartite tricarboxylate transporter substrate binding protein [Undibacter mobilis]
MRMKTTTGVLALLATLVAGPSLAQDSYPSQNIRFVVPFTAGSATDTLARVLANKMSTTLGRTITVENIAGGNGIPASQNVVRAEPNGYTVMVTSNTTHASNQALLKKVPYDAVKDFEPITKLGTITLALVGHPSVPANNVSELIAYAKANPSKLTFGSGSTSSRIAGELLKTMAGIDMLHVPYKSNPQVVIDLLGGQISLFFGDISTSLPPVRVGQLKGFAVSALKRSPLAADLPTIDESGLKGYELTAWFGAYAPANTPKPIIDKLNAAFREAIADKEVAERLLKAGIELEASSPAELAAFQAVETRKWVKIASDAKIEPE